MGVVHVSTPAVAVCIVGRRRHNLCLQQMVTVVTVRAKHGPRQPRPLLKQVLARQARFESRLAAVGRFSLAAPRKAIATEWRRITVI